MKLRRMMGSWLNFIIPLQKFGGRLSPLPENWIQQHAKFGRFFQRPTLIANISGTDRHVENRKKNSFNHNPFHVGRKKGELWSRNNRDPVVHIDTPKWIFPGDYISYIWRKLKIWPKIQSVRPYNFGASGINLDLI